MLLYLYIGSTAYVWVSTIKSMIDNDRRLKKEGYKFVGRKFGGVGDILLGGIFLIAMSIPVFNLLFPIVERDKERSYDEYKNMMLEAGHIEEPDIKEEIKSNIEKPTIKIVKKEIINQNKQEYYRPINNDDIDILESSGKTYKKELFRRH